MLAPFWRGADPVRSARLAAPLAAWYNRKVVAGWSSPVARWAHNPKVAGSNPAPATSLTWTKRSPVIWRPLAISGRVQHSRQIALQRHLQLVAIGLEQDRLDEGANGVRSPRPPTHYTGSSPSRGRLSTEASSLRALDSPARRCISRRFSSRTYSRQKSSSSRGASASREEPPGRALRPPGG